MFKPRSNRFFSLLALAALAACSKKAPPLGHEGKAIYAVGRPAESPVLEAHGNATCVARKDGRYCWGLSSYVRPTPYPRDASSVVAAPTHHCMLGKDGNVLCHGDNEAGALGNGETGKSSSELVPVQRMSDATQVAVARNRTCALARTGGKSLVYCWGHTEGKPDPRPEAAYPERVGTIEDAREIAIDEHLACVRRANGSVWCWGRGTSGELGRGEEGTSWTTTKRPSSLEPVRVLHLDDAVGIGVGFNFACALTARGTVGCWGGNEFGQLGDDSVNERSYPSDVAGLADVVQIAVGGSHACARKQDGTVWCWGRDGSVVDFGGPRFVDVYPWIRRTPQRVDRLADAIDLAAGETHDCARLRDESVVCWGNNENTQFGFVNPRVKATPFEVFPPVSR